MPDAQPQPVQLGPLGRAYVAVFRLKLDREPIKLSVLLDLLDSASSMPTFCLGYMLGLKVLATKDDQVIAGPHWAKVRRLIEQDFGSQIQDMGGSVNIAQSQRVELTFKGLGVSRGAVRIEHFLTPQKYVAVFGILLGMGLEARQVDGDEVCDMLLALNGIDPMFWLGFLEGSDVIARAENQIARGYAWEEAKAWTHEVIKGMMRS